VSLERDERPADSPFVQRITNVRFAGVGGGVTRPDGCWDLVFLRLRGRVVALQTGLITRPVDLGFASGDEYLCISFKPGVFMPRLPGDQMLDRGLQRPIVSRREFWMDGDRLEIPSFQNAEGLVARLARQGLLQRDEIVHGVLTGAPRAITPRSVQRHFLRTTGLTRKAFQQIQRANQAVELLRKGRPAVQVALDLGYADQPHLIRSLKRIMGQTPGEIARARS
jgi:hypothetical protein